MFTIDSMVLYVEDIQRSMGFYAKAFECEPKQLSPTFAVVEFANNAKVTLKQSNALTPVSTVKGGGTELSIPVADKKSFDEIYDIWKEYGFTFEQEREESVFGVNFVAVDPDQHRIRVFASVGE